MANNEQSEISSIFIRRMEHSTRNFRDRIQMVVLRESISIIITRAESGKAISYSVLHTQRCSKESSGSAEQYSANGSCEQLYSLSRTRNNILQS